MGIGILILVICTIIIIRAFTRAFMYIISKIK